MAMRSHQMFPRGGRSVWRAGAAKRASVEKVERRIIQTENALPATGTTWNPRNQKRTPNPIAERIAQPTPFVRGARDEVPPMEDSPFDSGAKEVAARTTPMRVTASPAPRSG